jgi:hypothetical protein
VLDHVVRGREVDQDGICVEPGALSLGEQLRNPLERVRRLPTRAETVLVLAEFLFQQRLKPRQKHPLEQFRDAGRERYGTVRHGELRVLSRFQQRNDLGSL